MPSELGLLTGLTNLNLAGNALEALPPELGRLTRLQLLGLKDNRLSELPTEVCARRGRVRRRPLLLG